MYKIKFSIELSTDKIDEKDLNTNDICEKSEPIFKMEDALVSHPTVYVSFFWITHQCVIQSAKC